MRFRVVSAFLLRFQLPAEFRAAPGPGLVFRPVQKFLYRLNPRLRHVRLLLRLQIGFLLRARLVPQFSDVVPG